MSGRVTPTSSTNGWRPPRVNWWTPDPSWHGDRGSEPRSASATVPPGGTTGATDTSSSGAGGKSEFEQVPEYRSTIPTQVGVVALLRNANWSYLIGVPRRVPEGPTGEPHVVLSKAKGNCVSVRSLVLTVPRYWLCAPAGAAAARPSTAAAPAARRSRIPTTAPIIETRMPLLLEPALDLGRVCSVDPIGGHRCNPGAPGGSFAPAIRWRSAPRWRRPAPAGWSRCAGRSPSADGPGPGSSRTSCRADA